MPRLANERFMLAPAARPGLSSRRSDAPATVPPNFRFAHEAAGGRVLGERYAMAVRSPFQINFLAV